MPAISLATLLDKEIEMDFNHTPAADTQAPSIAFSHLAYPNQP
jgi:hypothetical protein